MLAKVSKEKFTAMTCTTNVTANKQKEKEAFNQAKQVARQRVADQMIADAQAASDANNKEFQTQGELE